MRTLTAGRRAVLYTDNFEPITIIELKPWTIEHLMERKYVTLVVHEPMRAVFSDRPVISADCMIKLVHIRAERFVKDKYFDAIVLFTNDDENALLLKAAFLPGQSSAVLTEREDAFARGFLAALNMVGRHG